MKEQRPSNIRPLSVPQRLPDYAPVLQPVANKLNTTDDAPGSHHAGITASTDSTISTEPTGSDSGEKPGETVRSPERKKWVGNIAFPPKFIPRESGLTVSFVVGEHTEEGATVYHRVYSTKRFAERIQKTGMEKGQLIEVAGQLQMRDTKQKDGSIKPTPVVYAYGVRVLGNQATIKNPPPVCETESGL